MNAGEFGFIIEPQNGAPMPGGAAHATTTNPFSAVSGRRSSSGRRSGTLLAGLRFTQDDAGKTYEYTVRAVPPEDVTQESPTKNGVTYDFAAHKVSIKVIDNNGDGTIEYRNDCGWLH